MRTRFRFALCSGALPVLLLAMSTGLGQGAPREWRSPVDVGGDGGAAFTARCPRYSYLAGFSGGLGDDLDHIAPLCAELNSDGSRGGFTTAEVDRPSGVAGGNGGLPVEGVCPQTAPFVRTLYVAAEGVASVLVNTIRFGCGPIEGAIPRGVEGVSLFEFDGPRATAAEHGIGISSDVRTDRWDLPCDAGTTFAGIYGRAGAFVDAIGSLCRSVERLPAPPTLSQDRPVATTSAAAAASAAGPDPRASVQIQQGANGATVNAAPSGLEANQLLCRGGDTYPTGRYGQIPGNPNQEAYVIYLRPSQNVARADGSGLSPGTCGFANTVATDIAAITIAVDIGSRTLEELDAYLKSDPNHFWSFLLRRNEAMGMEEAIRNEQWVPPALAPSAVPTTSAIQGTASGVTGVGQETLAAGGRFPANLYQMNDAATITVGGRQMTVRDAKVEVEAELGRLAEPTRSFASCVIAAKNCEAGTASTSSTSAPATPPPRPGPASGVFPVFIYGIREDSALMSSAHSGAAPGNAGTWSQQEVDRPMGQYASLIVAGFEALYGATTDDTLRFWNAVDLHSAGTDRSILVPAFAPSAYEQIAAAKGAVYGFKAGGAVDVFRNPGLEAGGTAWQGPQRVADDWPPFIRVISGGDGVFYTLAADGTLLWRLHYPNGSWSASVVVGTGWGNFRDLISPGNGVIYAIQPNGDMLWHRFLGHQGGAAGAGWQGPIKVGDGWQNFRSVVALPAYY